MKRLWDEDTRERVPLRVVLLGSAPLLVQRGLSESLAGRFEVLHLPHWSLSERRAAFGFSLEQFLYFGGYPGAAPLAGDPARWRRYILDSLIETSISRDVLLLTRVDKPVLLRRLFELGCRHSGQVLSYTKMLGQLQDAGNTTTLAYYLDLLSGAGMLTGLPKYAGNAVRQRASSPKLQVFNTALVTARHRNGRLEIQGSLRRPRRREPHDLRIGEGARRESHPGDAGQLQRAAAGQDAAPHFFGVLRKCGLSRRRSASLRRRCRRLPQRGRRAPGSRSARAGRTSTRSDNLPRACLASRAPCEHPHEVHSGEDKLGRGSGCV